MARTGLLFTVALATCAIGCPAPGSSARSGTPGDPATTGPSAPASDPALPDGGLLIARDRVGGFTLDARASTLPSPPSEQGSVTLAPGVEASISENETVCELWVTNPAHRTAEGLGVGQMLSDWEAVYGKGEIEGATGMYWIEGAGLVLGLDGDDPDAPKPSDLVKSIRVGGCPE